MPHLVAFLPHRRWLSHDAAEQVLEAPCFFPAQHSHDIQFTDHADDLVLVIHNRHAADPEARETPCRFFQRRILLHRNHVLGHEISNGHT